MASDDLQRDLKLTRAEKEKQRQADAARELNDPWPLPDNISELKSFAFGNLTWRDAGFIGASILVPQVLMMPFSFLIPQIACVIIGLVIGIPLAFLSMKHVFTGDLPFEERVKIAIAERGKINLLNWDKTKNPDHSYVETSTQSFVPDLEFTDDNFALLPDNGGGFAVIELGVDDLTQSKNTEVLMTVNGFNDVLNALIKDTDCTPIQIMLKSVPKNLSNYIDAADDCTSDMEMKGKHVASARASDYASLLAELDREKAFYYKYYIVVTYREDAEHVGEKTMNTTSVRRERFREKGMNPLSQKAKVANQTEFDIGMTEEERKQYLKELNRDSEFGIKRTKAALSRRVGIVTNMLRDLGTTHTDVRPRILTKNEIAKLVFDCYNSEDKNVVDEVLDQALYDKTTMYSLDVYADYGDLFTYRDKEEEERKRKQEIAARSALGRVR